MSTENSLFMKLKSLKEVEQSLIGQIKSYDVQLGLSFKKSLKENMSEFFSFVILKSSFAKEKQILHKKLHSLKSAIHDLEVYQKSSLKDDCDYNHVFSLSDYAMFYENPGF